MNKKGFTLVELLVVIAIIAILSVIGITVFSDTQKNARDGRRKADIDAIAQAMEAKYDPIAATYGALAASMFASNTLPTDPGSNTYATTLRNSNKGFDACAQLEKSTGNSSTGNGTAPMYIATNNGAFYCKSSSQSQ